MDKVQIIPIVLAILGFLSSSLIATLLYIWNQQKKEIAQDRQTRIEQTKEMQKHFEQVQQFITASLVKDEKFEFLHQSHLSQLVDLKKKI